MCAVMGFELKNVTRDDISAIRTLFFESQIRGRHATGVSFLKEGKIHTIKEAVEASEFIKHHPPIDWVDENGNITAIAHCRYSTSDLRFNQPIADEKLSVVHNGVISQELPENWYRLYGIKCETANDTELLFHRPSLNEWANSSISALLLTVNGIEYMRNGKRPLWCADIEHGRIFASTSDIISRSQFKTKSKNRVSFAGIDLQP